MPGGEYAALGEGVDCGDGLGSREFAPGCDVAAAGGDRGAGAQLPACEFQEDACFCGFDRLGAVCDEFERSFP